MHFALDFRAAFFWGSNHEIILSNPEFVMKKIRFLLPIVAMVIAIFISCKTESRNHYDPLNGHDNIIKTKIKSGTKVLFIGDSVTDELDPNKEGLGSWVDRFSEYANLSVKNIAVCASTYSLFCTKSHNRNCIRHFLTKLLLLSHLCDD